MIIIAFGLLGIVIGILFPYHVPSEYSHYLAIVILALLDSTFGALSAHTRKEFNLSTFLAGFVGNGLLAAALTLIGKYLDVDLYLVALIVFGSRLFTNFTIMRRYYFNNFSEKFKKKSSN